MYENWESLMNPDCIQQIITKFIRNSQLSCIDSRSFFFVEFLGFLGLIPNFYTLNICFNILRACSHRSNFEDKSLKPNRNFFELTKDVNIGHFDCHQ